jgi:transposase-like protein
MNDGVTISIFQLAQMFPNQECARAYLEAQRWPEGAVCPRCAGSERIGTRKGGYYRCNACKVDFTVRTGTLMERSHIPLHKWLYTMYLLVTCRKGISSLQLSKQIGITQKSAWFLLHRLREACDNELQPLRGVVQIDETFVGGKKKNKPLFKRTKLGRGNADKQVVIGMREAGGGTRTQLIDSVSIKNITSAVTKHVEPGSLLYTDELPAYQSLPPLYAHQTVSHKELEYVRDEVTTNSIESVWAVMKRGLHGVYHHASKKHLARYANEFTFRLNAGNVKQHTLHRLNALVDSCVGKRITYRELTF